MTSTWFSLLRLWAVTMVMNLLGGFLITLMTHMPHSTDSDGLRVVPATVVGFLLGAGQVNHAIVVSILCFTASHAGASFGYAEWFGLFAFAALGNLIGGEPPQEHKRRSGSAGDRQAVHRSAGGYDDLPHGLDAPLLAIWSKRKQ